MIDFGETYTILEELGSGGGGTVYKAYHKRLQKEVALKKVHSNLEHINARTETDILKNIKHEYLPQILDFLETEDGIYTVMEYIPGKSFKDCLDGGKRFAERDIIVWFTQLCEALIVLHRQKPAIIHGDIKPANIMLTPDGRVCLIDFNIASIFEGNKTIVSGYTPGYAAPEQMDYYKQAVKDRTLSSQYQAADDKTELLEGEGQADSATEVLWNRTEFSDHQTEVLWNRTEFSDNRTEMLNEPAGMQGEQRQLVWDAQSYRSIVDARVDIYSLGATIYHLVSGVKPERQDGIVPDIRKVNSKTNPILADIVMKCLAMNPDERYQSIAEVHTALKNFYQSQSQYRKLVARQRVVRAFLLVGVFGFSILAYAGVWKLKQERTLAYQEAIEAERKCLDNWDEEQLEQYFVAAVDLYQDRTEAYELKARLLLKLKNYEACERFLVEAAIPYVTEQTGLCNLYLILGNSYMEEDNYAAAVEALASAVSCDNTNASAYGDYAVALARCGDVPNAKKQLETAVATGLSQAGILYTSGELKYAEREWDEADRFFKECLAIADDAYMQERAVLMRLDIQKQLGVSKETCEAKLQIIDQAIADYGSSMERVLLQEKVQACVDLATLLDDPSYNEIALKALNQIVDGGMASFSDYQNKVMLLLNMKSIAEAKAVLEDMLRRYGEDYRTYMWYAHAEAQAQMELENGERDYQEFDRYYQKAEELYREQAAQNYTDSYMVNLKSLYQDVVEKGWIGE